MSIQGQLNKLSLDELGVDFQKFAVAQDPHHNNQVLDFALRHLCNHQLPDSAPANDIYIEHMLRAIDHKFRNSEGYITWSEHYHITCEVEFDYDGDPDLGYVYTKAGDQ